jgi:hypothetical protein
MARSEYKTWLSLDDFAQIIGLDPLAFNQLSSSTLRRNNVCGDIFFQADYMHSDRIGRDTVAVAIQQAEQEMSREAGFFLMPDWTIAERLPYPRPGFPELYGMGYNPRGQAKSVEALRGYLISGGVREKTLIQANAVIVRTDTDGDGYAETCTVTVPVTITDTNEIHVYYPNQYGDDGWEVRPIKVSISVGFATITFKVWQVVSQTTLESLDPNPIDADLVASYSTLVDVYRVYNDPSTQVQFLWEGDPTSLNCCNTCVACQLGSQDGCFHLRDPRMGFVVPSPASWNAQTDEFDAAEWSACREPDQVKLWYYSGYLDWNMARPYVELSNYWKFAIAVFAVSKFERSVCGCSNVNQFVEKWRRDAAFSSMQEGGFTVTAELAANRLGTSLGALYAYRKIQQVKVNK